MRRPERTAPAYRPVSFVVLGLLQTVGPQTSYEMVQQVASSLSVLWQAPKSQLYAEPQRLAAQGLVTSTQESFGRRRRTFSITPVGRDLFDQWATLDATTHRDPELALLQLLFGDRPELAGSLARERISTVTDTLHSLTAPQQSTVLARRASSLGTLRLRAELAFWHSVLDVAEDTRPPLRA